MNTKLAAQIAAILCRKFEGLYLTPYICPAGVATVGFGATHYEDGRRVQLTDKPISRERAESLLVWHIERVYLPAVITLCPGVDTPERLAALVDFAFNLGAGNLRASTLRKRVNSGAWDEVPPELMRWVKGGGKTLKGLVLRRQAECGLI
jgi:lysozyme